MADSKTLKRLVGGSLVATLMLVSLGDGDAFAAKKRRTARKRGKSLVVQRINIANSANVPGNQIIEMTFNNALDASTIGHAHIQIRGENATQTGFTKQVFGTFQVDGNVVRFYPRLPTHLRDPSDPDGGFYPKGSARDNAGENAGLQPSTGYQIQILGADSISPVRSSRGRPLRNTVTVEFSTASASDPAERFTTSSYLDSPPPQFSFSNPPDRVPTAGDQYARSGGTRDVPADIALSLFCTKVPLSPTTMRVVGNVELTQTERDGSTEGRRPIGGAIFLEQNFSTTLMVFQPTFPLADRATYALKVRKSVKDLTEQFDFASNRERERLRAIYDWLSTARADSPGTPYSELTDPPAELIPDWPESDVERGILKTNLLTLGDARPDEVDPRVIVMFTTRDEPVSDAELVINFDRSEDLYDARISTAEWDGTVPSAASAILTIAAGDGRDGDFFPVANPNKKVGEPDVILNMDAYPNNTVSWRNVLIPQGVVVQLAGSRPSTLRGLDFDVQGELYADGFDGKAYNGSSYLQSAVDTVTGGKGGPGGGAGGDAADKLASSSNQAQADGDDGYVGVDEEGNEVEPEDGGRGGEGGKAARGTTYYGLGGGGGGGGARVAGTDGTTPLPSSTTYSWAGTGGKGGAGSDNLDLVPLAGGAGGGAGANGSYYISQGWGVMAGAGGGGGGAFRIQTARVLRVGLEGVIGARGGDGGKGTNYSVATGGGGGGGGGGSVLLQAHAGFDLALPFANLDVSGGTGGISPSSYSSVPVNGGDGGDGYLVLEDPDGGLEIPGFTSGGVFDPIGGGVPSLLYSKFADLGVQDPRLLNPTNDDILTDPANADGIYIECQLTREHPSLFGEPDLSALDLDTQDTLDSTITSEWTPYKVHDATGKPGGAFDIPGYNPGVQGGEYSFPVDQLNNKGYRFIRFRITFQLDDFHAREDKLPSVDKMTIRFQFNF